MADPRPGGLTCAQIVDLAPAFVLGALDATEMTAVRGHLAACPEAHEEMSELGAAAATLLESVEAVAPPAALGARIMAAARADAVRRTAAPAPAGPAPAVVAQAPIARAPEAMPPRPTLLDRLFGRRPAWAAIALAASIAVVALGAWNLQLRTQVDELSAYRRDVLAIFDAASKPGSQLAVLAAPDGSGPASGLAALAGDGSLALAMRDLAPTTGTQVYEVWLIGASGTPVPVGGFEVAGGGTGTFTIGGTNGAGVTTVALTLEPKPGATTPTPPLVALGTVRAAAD
jgi:hypothetical protein